jgi:uncharacterized protein
MARRASVLLVQALFAAAALLAPAPAAALRLDVERPGDREFIRDLAGLVDQADEEKIRQLADRLLTEKATPIIVVTIESMRKHGGEDLRIETFARLLFDQWGIGVEKLGETPWNTGILLLVSRDDRAARMELGAGWGRDKDGLCAEIMQTQIIARFKQGDFSQGVVAGVEALDKMARGLEIPRPARPWWHYALIAGAVLAAVLSAISLWRSGASGWAWVVWGVVFSIIGFILYMLLSGSSSGGRSSGGGGYSGGSFGGGYSGGGGASGSW